MNKIFDNNVISIKEAIWRTGWNMEEKDFLKKVENFSADALIMTKKGIKVNIKYLIIRN